MALDGPVNAGDQKSVVLGTYTTAQRNAGVSTADGTMIYNSTDREIQGYGPTGWTEVASLGSVSATGGTTTAAGITPGDGSRYHVFTSPGTFSVTSGSASVSLLVVGGGGGGGGECGQAPNNGKNGLPGTVTGSGGGNTGCSSPGTAGTGQGSDGSYPGGNSPGSPGPGGTGGGGGGGAGSYTGNPNGGAGGVGRACPGFPAPAISPEIPSPVRTAWTSAVGPTGLYGGGGGGGSYGGGPGPGGPGGGGPGYGPGGSNNAGTDGVRYTGGGGGGGSPGNGNNPATLGGDGIVIVKYSV